MTEPTGICRLCRDPGRCCRDLPLSATFPPSATALEVEAALVARGGEEYAVMIALRPDPHEWPEKDIPGRVRWRFACRALGPDGRCTVYERRPGACRHYEPLQDSLCVMHGVDLSPPEAAVLAAQTEPRLLPARAGDSGSSSSRARRYEDGQREEATMDEQATMDRKARAQRIARAHLAALKAAFAEAPVWARSALEERVRGTLAGAGERFQARLLWEPVAAFEAAHLIQRLSPESGSSEPRFARTSAWKGSAG